MTAVRPAVSICATVIKAESSATAVEVWLVKVISSAELIIGLLYIRSESLETVMSWEHAKEQKARSAAKVVGDRLWVIGEPQTSREVEELRS
jgi:hypothetical protein